MHKAFGWIRMHSRKEHAEDLLRGKLYFNTIAHHRKKGNDPLEGILRREVNVNFSASDGQNRVELNDAPGCIKVEFVNLEYTPVFCMTAIGGKIEKDTYENHVNLAKQFEVSKKYETEFGDHAVVIYRPTEFIDRFLKSAKNHAIDHSHGWVNYVSSRGSVDKAVFSLDILFYKREKFKYENEYRLVVYRYTKDEGHFELDVGDLSDIAFYCKTSEINHNFRVVPNDGPGDTFGIQVRKPWIGKFR